MLINLDEPKGLAQDNHYDFCIVGTGPAGITTALKLADAGKRVALLEGGGENYSQASQDLYKGKCTETTGFEYWDNVTNCRQRFLGGTSNHWGGMCGYFEDAELSREMNGLSAWPISKAQIFEHFEEAKDILDLPKAGFKPKQWGGKQFNFYNYESSPPTRFKTKYFETLKAHRNIDLFLNANLTDVQLTQDFSAVDQFSIVNNAEQKFSFKAKQFVLAMGAIENARMLLAANKQIPTGIGNQNDMVGRCFMEHLNVDYGRFVADNPATWKANNNSILLSTNAAFSAEQNISSGVISFTNNNQFYDYGRFADLKKKFRNIVCQSESATELVRSMTTLDCDGDGFVSSMVEQSPNLDSRITLDTEKDRLGIPRIILDWRCNDLDIKTIRSIGIEAAKEMAKLGLARVRLNEPIINNQINMQEVGGHCHQMGTTRMSTNPKDGVVDENQKVHGIDNLFMGGSSVYPTGGYCNPTFTLVMLSLRLAKHLEQV